MISPYKILLFLTIVVAALLNVSAQERIIAENEFKEIQKRAEEKLHGKIYRLTMTEEQFSDRAAEPERINIRIRERIPPDKTRDVDEVKSATENTRTERIWDGKNLYVKENDGEWKKFSSGGSAGGSIVSGRITTSYKFIEKTSLGNQTVNVYEAEMNRRAVKLTQTSRFEIHYVEKTRFWISDDGHFLKTVRELQAVGSKSLLRDTWIYEYDSNIRIEAPVE